MKSERVRIGRVAALFQHPVKSMAANSLESATLDWHGVVGDRRFAFRRTGVETGNPWLSAGRMASLVQYRPETGGGIDPAAEPTHVVTPAGDRFELRSEALRAEISQRFGAPVELMQLNHGMFDEAEISVISTTTIRTLERETGRDLDVRRFRPNILVEPVDERAFGEDDWVGRLIAFGNNGPRVAVTMRDLRCSMIGLDPDTAKADPTILKATVRLNDTFAGVYGTVLGTGTLRVGDDVFLD